MPVAVWCGHEPHALQVVDPVTLRTVAADELALHTIPQRCASVITPSRASRHDGAVDRDAMHGEGRRVVTACARVRARV